MDVLQFIRQMQEMYGDELIKPASELPRPQQALDREMFENAFRDKKADGGQLVKPNADETRPGYAGEKKQLITTQQLSELDFPISGATIKQVFQTKDRAKNFKKIFKDNNIKVVKKGKNRFEQALYEMPTKKQIDGVWKDTLESIKSGKNIVTEKMRAPFVDEVQKIFNEFSKTNTPFSTSDIYYKLVERVQDNPRIYIPVKVKKGTRVPGEAIKRALDKDQISLLMDGNLQRIEKAVGNRKKLIEILSKDKSDINTLKNTLGINRKELFAEADLLFDDIYRYTSAKVRKTGYGKKYGYLKDLSISDYKNLLNNLRGSGFAKLDERSLRALITDAYAEKNPKKYDAATKKLNQYTKLNNQLNNLFGFNFQLDHPLSFQALKDLDNVSAENLLRVNPIPENINQFKIGFDRTYQGILNKIRAGDTSPELLNRKKAIETLSTELGIGKFRIDNTGRKVLTFGADPFLKTNLTKKMGENIFLEDTIAKNVKKINPQLIKQAGLGPKAISSLEQFKAFKPLKVKGLIAFMKKNGIPCKLSEGVNCNFPQAYEKSLNELAAKAQAGDNAAQSKLVSFGKNVVKAGKVIKNVMGPYAVATEIALAVPSGAYGYAKGQPLSQIANTLTYGLAGEDQIERLKKQDPNFGATQRLDAVADRLNTLEKMQKGTRGQKIRSKPKFEKAERDLDVALLPFTTINPQIEAGRFLDPDAYTRRIEKDASLMAADQAAMKQRATDRGMDNPFNFSYGFARGGLSGGDTSGPPPEKGPMSQGLLSLYKNGRKL